MFYKYNFEWEQTKSTAYIGALGAVTTYVYIFILNIFKLLNIGLVEIPYWGEAKWLDYILSIIIVSPIIIILCLLYPPQKVKELNKSFEYNIYKNIFFITLFIIMFFALFIKF